MSVERFVGLVSVLALVGCGPIAGGDYFGEVLFEIEGMVLPDEDVEFEGDVGVALLWANQEELDRSAQAVVVETRFPARYKLKIYAPPNADSELDVSGEQVLTASVAQILLFEDVDSDGVWDRDVEARIGGAYNTALLFVPDDGLPYAEVEADPDFVTGDPAALPPDPLVSPIWTPVPGFTVVDVAPGPFCQRPWETWMEPKDAKAATLYVGFFRLDNDWDCDGNGDDFIGPDVQAPPDDPLFGDECPPLEIMQEECDFLRTELETALAQPVSGPSAVTYLQDWLVGLESCYAQVCPDLVARLNDLAGP